jgi:voltage-gated potassium channel
MGAAALSTKPKIPRDKYVFFILALAVIYAIAVLDLVFVEGKSFEDALLESMCTSLYVDCSSSAALSTKIVHIMLGLTTIAVIVLLVSEGVDYLIKNALEGHRGMKKTIQGMRNHIIVCGYGELGKTLCETLLSEGKDFVVVDNNPKVVEKVVDAGIPALEGDALNPKVLDKAGLKRALRIVGALNSDSSNVFLTLTAKELNSRVAVATRAYSEDAVPKLHRAGADIIVMPEIIGGVELAKEILGIDRDHGKRLVSKRLV